jgi:hypothetical protein
MLGLMVAAVTLLAIPPQRSSDYALTEQQRAMVRSSFKSERFPTASEAAYAASLRYGRELLTVEVGAKIYVDIVQGVPVYSYGPPLTGQTDDDTDDEEIVYDPLAADGHFRAIGFWHEHPTVDDWFTLYGHYAQIAVTHQTIWTTIGRDFFVQFWDGSRPAPAWTAAVPAIAPLAPSDLYS